MNINAQIAVVHITGAGADLAVYAHGSQISAADPGAGDDTGVISELAENLARAHGLEVTHIEYPVNGVGSEWNWTEVQIDLINAGNLVAPVGNNTLMRGFYRCPQCFGEWVVVDDTNAAVSCIHCKHGDVEAYASGEADAYHGDDFVLRALSAHERAHPSPLARGAYEVSISRTATRHASVIVEGAAGPVSANLLALERAPNRNFNNSEVGVNYEVGGVIARKLLRVGKPAFWSDPDEGLCSGEVTVLGVSGESVVVKNKQGSESEVPFDELEVF